MDMNCKLKTIEKLGYMIEEVCNNSIIEGLEGYNFLSKWILEDKTRYESLFLSEKKESYRGVLEEGNPSVKKLNWDVFEKYTNKEVLDIFEDGDLRKSLGVPDDVEDLNKIYNTPEAKIRLYTTLLNVLIPETLPFIPRLIEDNDLVAHGINLNQTTYWFDGEFEEADYSTFEIYKEVDNLRVDFKDTSVETFAPSIYLHDTDKPIKILNKTAEMLEEDGELKGRFMLWLFVQATFKDVMCKQDGTMLETFRVLGSILESSNGLNNRRIIGVKPASRLSINLKVSVANKKLGLYSAKLPNSFIKTTWVIKESGDNESILEEEEVLDYLEGILNGATAEKSKEHLETLAKNHFIFSSAFVGEVKRWEYTFNQVHIYDREENLDSITKDYRNIHLGYQILCQD
jgi:hypothetical protein